MRTRSESADGLLLEVLLPRTDAGVAAQAVVLLVMCLLLLRAAVRAGLLRLWISGTVFAFGVFSLRGLH